mgnify:CR=1 FL=1
MAILKPQLNIPMNVTLSAEPRGRAEQGQYGIQYLYGCEEGLIYADAKLHAALSPYPAGTQVMILKAQESFQSAEGEPRRANTYTVTGANGLPTPPMQGVPTGIPPTRPATGDFASMVHLLRTCMGAVEDIAPDTYGPAERQASAISLFIGCQQRNVSAPEPTAETVPTNPAEDPDMLPF